MTRYTTELIPTPAPPPGGHWLAVETACPECGHESTADVWMPAPPPAADAPDTAAGTYRERVAALEMAAGWDAGFDFSRADYATGFGHARALAAAIAAEADAVLDAARFDLDVALQDRDDTIVRAEAAEAECARLRLALDYIANNSGAPTEAAPHARAALAHEAALDALAAHAGGATGTGTGTGGAG